MRVLSPAPGPSTTQPPSPAVPQFGRERSIARSPAPYRPGFQPKGVYRPRTDEFVEARKANRDVGRIERTRLERRFEKLMHLHFPSESQKEKEKLTSDKRPPPRPNKRLSSIFEMDFSELRSKSASDLWRDVVQSQVASGGKNDIREEVSEGVDYGVRRRPSATPQARGQKEEKMSEDEKFLKGVRICRDCRPVLLREQYKHESRSIPIFFRLYDAFISLEKEIEDSLPQFQELMLTLSKREQPTPEASAARKRLLEAFGQYDALAKRIRQLPTAAGPGSSQDRIQAAIASRANQFLQKNMFPLQSLPKATNGTKSPASTTSTPEESQIDPDSELARTLQPLLEQEALLETFVEEAKAHRKFEDAKTLKTNLQEIRAEINRIVASADASVAGNSRRGSARAKHS
ncbi:hypothetical protein EVJ58_g1618 [Rhodofomes roseus]|uniref:Rabenosyn Rab binding domain-containing protein n=1 Tax=Rhodofomes roseus TaxID=34475 RepID=A0A4Y9YXW1_9APHY|nr:hypothetical protein EVJ58_g1618 [Rhodofomes roseus]